LGQGKFIGHSAASELLRVVSSATLQKQLLLCGGKSSLSIVTLLGTGEVRWAFSNIRIADRSRQCNAQTKMRFSGTGELHCSFEVIALLVLARVAVRFLVVIAVGGGPFFETRA